MVDVSMWLAAGVAILVLAYALTTFFWRPELNVDRLKLGHWFRSLIRLYESDSLVRVSHRGSTVRLTLQRRAGEGVQCWVVLSCPRARWTTAPLGAVREAIAGEPRVLILPDLSQKASGREAERLDVQVSIPDIWSSEAADAVVRIAHRVLDALGVPANARFDLEFVGEQSMERSFEARRRQREGTLEEW
jgi:hypothetical protein